MWHLVTATGADALATRSRGLGATHAPRSAPPTTAASLSSSSTHDHLLADALQLAFHFLQLLAQHIGFLLEPAQLVLFVFAPGWDI